MKLENTKPLILLGVVIAFLLVILLVVKLGGSSNSSTSNTRNDHNKQQTNSNIKYPKVNDSAEVILSKVYSPNHDYYTGFDSNSYTKENIFGNKKQKSASSFSERTRMTIALNTFKISNMQKINCNNVSWNNNWPNSSCGSNLGKVAYTISVQELNNRIEDIFNIKPDYSELNIDDLSIGTCTSENKDNYIFRYIKQQSIFVSTKRNSSCNPNGKIEITNVSKKQSSDIITLDVYYKSTQAKYLAKKYYYGESTDNHDQFFYKVRPDGTYYFSSSTVFQKANE